MFYDFISKNNEFFVEKMREAFAIALHIFSKKNISLFEMLTFGILTTR